MRWCCFLLLSGACVCADAPTALDDLTGPWQLFVDDYLVSSSSGITRSYHAFEKYPGNPVIVNDRPWEGPVYLYGTVMPDESGSGFRMWYHTLRPNDTNNDGSLELYATSADGVHWTKPILNLRSWHGSTSNNMYFTRPTPGGMTSVMHTPWDPDPAKRYKFMNFDQGGYFAAWSPDGIHVIDAPLNPVFTGGSDVGQFCWDPHTQQYLGYVKNAWYDDQDRKRRAVALTTTTNIEAWPHESLILWPDAFDDRWAPVGAAQRTHFYGLSAFPYESMYVGLLWIFRATDAEGYYVGPVFAELVTSRDGVQWKRQEGQRPPILPLGPAGAWDAAQIYTSRAPVRDNDTLKLWYGGFDKPHGTALNDMNGGIGLATLRKDGFASLNAAASPGTITTRPLEGASGVLRLNYIASSGSIKVEVLDATGQVLPGYAHADCIALAGNSIDQAVAWTGHSELPHGMASLRLRFILQNAQLFSFMAGAGIRVIETPAINIHPEDRAVPPGGTATFTVAASGKAPLDFQWQKNQVNLSDGENLIGCRSATLTITNANVADAASYRCVVMNGLGNAASHPATLRISTHALAARSLTSIPLLPGDSANEARAMTPDGAWVVGVSGSRGFLHRVNTTNVYFVATPDGSESSILTGAGYRFENGQKQVVMSGLSVGWNAHFMTTDGLSFGLKRRDTYVGSSPKIPPANALAGSTGDAFYSAWWDVTSGIYTGYVGRLSGPWPMSAASGTVLWEKQRIAGGSTLQLNGISSTGRAVGGRNTPRENYVVDWTGAATPAAFYFNGLDGATRGQALAVSANGQIVFGNSPRPGNEALSGYKVSLPGPSQTIAELPNFLDTGSSTTLAAPYGCTADGRYAAGMNYRGAEKAALWITTDPDPSKWSVDDLTEVAARSSGTGIFLRLARAYTMGTNNDGTLVIAGTGIATNGSTRAFVMTVTPPTPSTTLIPQPVVAITHSQVPSLLFSFATVNDAAVMYHLETKSDLAAPDWITIASTPGSGGVALLEDADAKSGRGFYRVRVD